MTYISWTVLHLTGNSITWSNPFFHLLQILKDVQDLCCSNTVLHGILHWLCLWIHCTRCSSLKNLFIYILLYNIVLVLPYINMNPPRVYMSSQSWTPLPPLSPYHLSGSSQCTSPKHPVSCIEPRLAICFLHDSVHVSMPFSQIIPPSSSPTETKSLFYTSVSLLLSYIQGYRYHLDIFCKVNILGFAGQ